MNVLTSDLQQITYGHDGTGLGSDFTSTPADKERVAPAFQTEISANKQERMIPLIKDEENTYDNVLINPSKLRNAEMKAIVSKSPPVFLLNKVVEMVFSKTELQNSKGVRGLDAHKMEAVREYIYAKGVSLGWEQINPKTFTQTVQNKIGNLRFRSSASKVAVLKKQ
ncbi:hypothetical protein FSP39_011079 [Pinctada imbricata]|uniref:BEN domain-containing protein n=1 Tax=Pinctada imbricata TaxID=66713 RepID=A0AA88XIQ8_PINIB|nr:hypothetical protein FSP39_011079 [Pinctada imbricata]